MRAALTFLAQSGLCLAVFYLAFELFLRRETYFQLNRIFLVSGLWCSLLIPAFRITSPFKTLVLPAPDSAALTSGPTSAGFGLVELASVLYAAGAAVLLSRLVLQLLKLRRVIRINGIRRLRGVKIVAVERLFSPFSFFDLVFLNPGPSLDANLRRILAHEQVHIRQKHTLDVLLMEIVLSIQWFNPFVWPYKKALQETHEYLADAGVIAQGFSPVRYQLHMFEQNVGASLFEFGNNFKKSQIKRRIIMLSKMKSPGPARLKLLVALPLVAGLVLAFAQPRLVAGPSSAAGIAPAQDQSAAKELQAKEEMKKLLAMEAEFRKKLEVTTDESAVKEIKMTLEKIAKKRQDLSLAGGAPSGKSSAPAEEMNKRLTELKAMHSDLQAKLEATSDPDKKAEIEAKLKEIQAKAKVMTAEFEKAAAAEKAKSDRALK
ncbi:MAG: hypothetical protein JW843_09830 [Candidatus Aminicenantes bacterium]|nr:hypothetical protein [Candidatus Aminicenantes bacterium]